MNKTFFFFEQQIRRTKDNFLMTNSIFGFFVLVFEILLHFVEFSDWEKAFYHVIPKRKGVTLHQSKSRDSTCSLTMPAIDEASETEDRTMLFNQEEKKNRKVVA